jgi:septum formation inhibitor MinC
MFTNKWQNFTHFRYPPFSGQPFESPFDKRLTVLSNVEGLKALSGSTSSPPRVKSRGKVEGLSAVSVRKEKTEYGRQNTAGKNQIPNHSSRKHENVGTRIYPVKLRSGVQILASGGD